MKVPLLTKMEDQDQCDEKAVHFTPSKIVPPALHVPSVMYLVFTSLIFDLLGFTMILPLMPSLLDHYHRQDGDVRCLASRWRVEPRKCVHLHYNSGRRMLDPSSS
ncbi:major facilitator superfamily domain-containing protein 10-like [Tropilaelaps mercedesae]|uniref:Major facilitator superfamily domain-containing protein 10-like n=1 Tax=Tropilaelaps mercedesae TaxID=418985 RepID=A0A1V9WZ38_9ACAR|nr:major facilitator superfamily domain-containing protein 10-like [Tropilaelaps mercedesae]